MLTFFQLHVVFNIKRQEMSLAVILVAVHLVTFAFSGADAITPPDTSLDTIPVSYFGGVNCKERSQENIEMLAKMRLIVIEKWEGPCWYKCYANLTMKPPVPCQPSCGAENYQMKTIKRAKAVNPKLAAVFYLNTLYDFPFLELHGKFLKANADVIDVNGKLVAFKNDNGMPNINVFDLGQKVGRDLWTDFVQSLADTGLVDGLFDDKSNILAMWNETGSFWQICEWGTGKGTWDVSCGIISNETAMNYNNGKPMVLDALHKTFGPTGVVFFNTTAMMHMKDPKSPLQFAKEVKTTLSTYQYGHVQTRDLIDGDCTSTKSSCTEDEIAMFLLGVEEGVFLGCNGWDENFSKPLGTPLGPATQKNKIIERHFKSGTYVTWDLTSNKGKVTWAE